MALAFLSRGDAVFIRDISVPAPRVGHILHSCTRPAASNALESARMQDGRAASGEITYALAGVRGGAGNPSAPLAAPRPAGLVSRAGVRGAGPSGALRGDSGGVRLQEAALRRHRHRLRPGSDRQLVEDRGQVLVDGAGREEEPLPDRLAGEPLSRQPQHLSFARAKGAGAPVGRGRWVRRRVRSPDQRASGHLPPADSAPGWRPPRRAVRAPRDTPPVPPPARGARAAAPRPDRRPHAPTRATRLSPASRHPPPPAAAHAAPDRPAHPRSPTPPARQCSAASDPGGPRSPPAPRACAAKRRADPRARAPTPPSQSGRCPRRARPPLPRAGRARLPRALQLPQRCPARRLLRRGGRAQCRSNRRPRGPRSGPAPRAATGYPLPSPRHTRLAPPSG